MGAVPLVGGVGQRQPFLGSVGVGQQMATKRGMVREGMPPAVDPGAPTGDERREPDRGPSPRALERRRAWGRLKKLEAEELADYLATIAGRMEELDIPPGIVKKFEKKLRGFAETAAPQAELQLSDAEIAELDQAILSYEEVESKETVKRYAIGAGVIAAIGVGAAILL